MKNFLFLLFFLSSINFLFAQKNTKKEIDFNGNFIQIDLGKIDHLEIQQTNQSKVTISTKELQQEATFLQIEQENSGLYIRENSAHNIKEELPACIEEPLFTTYKITIPNQVKVYININAGNFYSENFNGFLKLNVDNGEIFLKNCTGNITIKNIDGIINCTTSIQDIVAKSHLGKEEIFKKPGASLKNNIKNMLRIESIRGNIFINAKKTF